MNVSCRVVMSALVLVAVGSTSASNLNFLDKSPAAKFTTQDYELLKTAALELLTGGVKGAGKDWSNPATTASGKLVIVNVFTSTEGFNCKTLRVENMAGGRRGRATYPVCEIHPGDWQIHAAAKPASAAKPTLEGALWLATDMGMQPIVLAKGQRAPEITLETSGHRLSGFGGCNRIVGKYEIADSKLKLSQTVSTRMACVQGMDLEQQLLKALDSTTSWRISDAHLEFLDGSGTLLVRFAPK